MTNITNKSKFKTLLTSITLLLSAPSIAEDSVTILFGGYSSHQTEYAKEYKYNADHNLFGIVIDDKYTLATLENSYYNRSYLMAYNHNLWEDNLLGVDLGASVQVGLITGYKSKMQMGDLYLGNELSVHIMPIISMSYNINTKWSVGLDQSIMPTVGGWVYFNNFNVKLRF